MAAGMLHIAQINAQLKTTVLNFTSPVKFLDPADCSIEQSAENLRAVQDYRDRTSIPTNIRGDSNNVMSLAVVNTIIANFHIVSLSAGLQSCESKPNLLNNLTNRRLSNPGNRNQNAAILLVPIISHFF
jgi:hypothetical protein